MVWIYQVSYRLMGLNSWSPAGGAVCEVVEALGMSPNCHEWIPGRGLKGDGCFWFWYKLSGSWSVRCENCSCCQRSSLSGCCQGPSLSECVPLLPWWPVSRNTLLLPWDLSPVCHCSRSKHTDPIILTSIGTIRKSDWVAFTFLYLVILQCGLQVHPCSKSNTSS